MADLPLLQSRSQPGTHWGISKEGHGRRVPAGECKKATTGELNEVQSYRRRGVLQYAPTPGFFFMVLRLGVLVSQTIGMEFV